MAVSFETKANMSDSQLALMDAAVVIDGLIGVQCDVFLGAFMVWLLLCRFGSRCRVKFVLLQVCEAPEESHHCQRAVIAALEASSQSRPGSKLTHFLEPAHGRL